MTASSPRVLAVPVLRELTRADWLRLLHFPASRVPAVLILRGTRNLRSQYEAALPYFSNVHEVGAPNGIFEDVFVGELRGRTVGFACVYGACMASEIVHVFGVLGTRAVIQTGNCGALSNDMAAGDLLVADRAYCGEGAAQYYRGQNRWTTASASLLRSGILTELDRRGAIYTTAALLAEGVDDLERWFRQGFAAVDMETATTYAVAEHFGMERIAILYAFDNPRRYEHLLLSDTERETRRFAANTRMRELAFDLAEAVSAG
jgi:purine-nucleoside phosphorylase